MFQLWESLSLSWRTFMQLMSQGLIKHLVSPQGECQQKCRLHTPLYSGMNLRSLNSHPSFVRQDSFCYIDADLRNVAWNQTNIIPALDLHQNLYLQHFIQNSRFKLKAQFAHAPTKPLIFKSTCTYRLNQPNRKTNMNMPIKTYLLSKVIDLLSYSYLNCVTQKLQFLLHSWPVKE